MNNETRRHSRASRCATVRAFQDLPDGCKAYDVPNPDFLMISRTVIDIGIASDPTAGIYDRIVRVSPLHIVRVENLQAAA